MTITDEEGFDPSEEGYALPYEYTENNRAGSPVWTLIILLMTPVLGGLALMGVQPLPLWLILLPVGLVIVRQSVYQLLVNAFHEALRCAHSDALLDAELAQQALEEAAEETASSEHALDPVRFQQRLAERNLPRSDED